VSNKYKREIRTETIHKPKHKDKENPNSSRSIPDKFKVMGKELGAVFEWNGTAYEYKGVKNGK
jgi:hypothetical protein